MYWLRACVDIDSATEEANKGRHDAAAGYREYAPIVTIPLRRESLNFVSSSPCFRSFLLNKVEKVDLKIVLFNIIIYHLAAIRKISYFSHL